MAVPACDSADDDPGPDGPAGAEAAVRQALTLAAGALALAVAEMAARPRDDAALEMARISLAVVRKLGEAARGRAVSEAVQAEKERRAFDAGVAAGRAQRRRRLGLIPGGG